MCIAWLVSNKNLYGINLTGTDNSEHLLFDNFLRYR